MKPEEVQVLIQKSTQKWMDANTPEVIEKKVFARLDEEFDQIFLAWMGIGYSFGRLEVTKEAVFKDHLESLIGDKITKFIQTLPEVKLSVSQSKKIAKLLQDQFDYKLETAIRRQSDLSPLVEKYLEEITDNFSAEKLKQAGKLLQG